MGHRRNYFLASGLLLLILVPTCAAKWINPLAGEIQDEFLFGVLWGVSLGVQWGQATLLTSIAVLHAGPQWLRLACYLAVTLVIVAITWLSHVPIWIHNYVPIGEFGHAGPALSLVMVAPLFVTTLRTRWMLTANPDLIDAPRLTTSSWFVAVTAIGLAFTFVRIVQNTAIYYALQDPMIYLMIFGPVLIGIGVFDCLACWLLTGQPRHPLLGWMMGGLVLLLAASASTGVNLLTNPTTLEEVAKFAVFPITTLVCCGGLLLVGYGWLRMASYRLVGRTCAIAEDVN